MTQDKGMPKASIKLQPKKLPHARHNGLEGNQAQGSFRDGSGMTWRGVQDLAVPRGAKPTVAQSIQTASGKLTAEFSAL